MRMRLAPLALLLVAASLAGVGTSRAQPRQDDRQDLRAAFEAYERADFEQSRAGFERVALERASNVDALAEAYAGLALTQLALGDEVNSDAALRALISLAPDHRFAAVTPPRMEARFREHLRESLGPLAVEVFLQEVDGESEVVARVQRDPAGIVTHIRLESREPGGAWSLRADGETEVRTTPDASVELRAVLISASGARLVEQRLVRDEPWVASAPAADWFSEPPASPVEATESRPRWVRGVWIAVGVVAAAAATGAGVYLVTRPGNTSVQNPTLR